MNKDIPPQYDTRNIIDAFRGLSVEEIKSRINRNNFSVGMVNHQYEINIGTMVRITNAFAGREFLIIGNKRYDRRSTVGTHNYETVVHVPDAKSLKDWLVANNRPLIAIEQGPSSIPIHAVESYPENPVFIFGNENTGIPADILAIADMKVYIPQMGSVRSLNVSSACSIVVYDWCAKHLWNKQPI